MNHRTEQKVRADEHFAWYNDPRLWVLALAALLFFFTLTETEREKKERQTVSVPTTTMTEPIGATAAQQTGIAF